MRVHVVERTGGVDRARATLGLSVNGDDERGENRSRCTIRDEQ
jgi:hypothetical protein